MNDKHLNELFEFLSIPSISAQSEYRKDIKQACLWLEKKLKKIGFETDIIKTKGQPLIYAERFVNKKFPTVLVYGHYDVQSPDPLEEWFSDPFKPEIRGGNIYARGASDNKGQLFTWIAAAEDLGKKCELNLKFIIEGEEEIGSENFDDFVNDNKSLLSADICVISDSHAISPTQPLISYGLRGIAYFEIKIETMPKDVHSGIYGGNVANPAIILSQIISKMKSEDEKINIEGFYRNVRKLTKQERSLLSKLPFGEKEILEETGAINVLGESGFSVHERAGARPTLDVNGVWAGYTLEGQKTIIPGVAHAKISMRLVPNQDPYEIEKIFKKFVSDNTPVYAKSEVKTLSLNKPVIMDIKNPYFKKAEKALIKVFGSRPIYELSGGTIGAASAIKNILRIDSILMGYGLPDDGIHSPNEKISLEMFEKGINANKIFLFG